MKKILSPLFLSCSLWGITDGQVWTGSIPRSDSNIALNSGDNFTIYLDRDPNANQAQANDFGSGSSTNLNLTANGGSASLTLTKKASLNNLQFYHDIGSTISVSQNAHLTISIGSHDNSSNIFLLSGGTIQIGNGGKWTLKGVYTMSIGSDGGNLVVNNGGSVEIVWVKELKIVTKIGKKSGVTNNGGNIVLKTEFGIFNSSFNTDPYYQQGSSNSAGVITHNSGTTTIRHREDGKESLFYNAGYGDFGAQVSKNRHALLEVNGGTFNVVGNLYNGGKDGGSGGAGVGWIVGRGGTINVSNTLYNYSLDSSLPSKIDLENSTIQAKTLLNRANGEIYLKDKAHIEATTFTSDTNSKVVFIGNGDGFGSITAQSLDLQGEEIFKVDILKKTTDLKYLIATSPNTQGFNLGTITIQDINGATSDRYTADLAQDGENTYIQLTPKNGYVPPTPPTNPPTPPTTTPPNSSPSPQNPSTSTDYISNSHSIQTELTKQYVILTNSTLEQTTQTILSQIKQIQSLKSINTYALSNLYNRSIQTQIKKPKPFLAYNQPTSYPMPYTQGDYLPPPLFEREKKLSVFANLIGGVFGYDSHIGGNYGINAGADYLLGDNLFLGGYGVLLGKTLQQEGLQMQGFEVELGGYGRYLLSEWEFDTTLSYSLLNTHTQRSFTLYSQTFSQDASFNTHFFNLEERVGYRFDLSDFDTLKPFGGVAMHIYAQPSYEESGNFAYSQSDVFYGALGLLAGVEYRKIFQSSSFYLGASFLYQLPIFGDTTYSLQYLDSLLYFQNSQDLIAQIQAGLDLSLTPNSFLSFDFNYHHSLSKYFNVDMMIGYRHLF